MKRGYFAIIGFLLLLFGLVSLFLSVIGLKLSFLAFLDIPGRLFSFVAKLCMIFGGVIIMYLDLGPKDLE